MTNPYKKYLDSFFENLLYYRHISGRINKVLQKEIRDYSEEKAIIHFTSALVISDWTGPTDNGWEKTFTLELLLKQQRITTSRKLEKYSQGSSVYYMLNLLKHLKDSLKIASLTE